MKDDIIHLLNGVKTMSKRSKLSRSGSKKLFEATSNKTHKLNAMLRPMRGGTRL
jgi:hypothetical protein